MRFRRRWGSTIALFTWLFLALGSTTSAQQDSPASAPEDRETSRDRRFILHNSWAGPVGGVRAVDAGSGPAQTFRIQLAMDFFGADDYLYPPVADQPGDKNRYTGGALSLSFTPAGFLEIYTAIEAHLNDNDRAEPEVYKALGDTTLGLKAFGKAAPWLVLGGDLRVALRSPIDSVGIDPDATSLGIRGNATADLRETGAGVPIIARLNLDYFLDNSAELAEDLENERMSALDDTLLGDELEHRHLVMPVERLAMGINRVDMFSIGLGVEAPLALIRDFYVNPIAEWRLGLPINRQKFSCLVVPTLEEESAGKDNCLSKVGFEAFPHTLTLGARILPSVKGLALMVAADIGLGSSSVFVRELAPNRPYSVMFSLGYAYDARPARPIVRRVIRAAEMPGGGTRVGTRLRGLVVDAKEQTPIADARIQYNNRDLTDQMTTDQGKFVSCGLEPGEVQVQVSHPQYESAVCVAEIPDRTGADATGGGEERDGAGADIAANPFDDESDGSTEKGEGADEGSFVSLRCALEPRPEVGSLVGRILDMNDAPLPDAHIELDGPVLRSATTDELGDFKVERLPPGKYTVRAEAQAYFIKFTEVEIAVRETATTEIRLIAKAGKPLVKVIKPEIRLRRQIEFTRDSAEIDRESEPILAAVTETLLRHTELSLIEVQVHTDDRGGAERNLALSQERADAIQQWLIKAGVPPVRLEAKGYGQSEPLVPNSSSANRARNRRVEFVIKE